MAFPSGSLYGSDASFTPLFRLLDDFDNYSHEARGDHDRLHQRRRQPAGTFNPKFDIWETDEAYELHGELPGIHREQIDIEFTDPQTLVIRGRIEHAHTNGSPTTSLAERSTGPSGTIAEKAGAHASLRKPDGNNGDEAGGQGAIGQPMEKYWIKERPVGAFARTFGFPSRVDQAAVAARLNNGILSLVVPKAKSHHGRRIAIH